MPTRSLDGAGAVKFALGSNIGRVRQLWGVEVSKKQARPKRIYSRSVFFTPAADSKNRCSVGRIRLSSVLRVAGTGNVAKIFNPVIRPYPVYVVNVVAGPNTVDIQPSKSVGLVSVTPQREADIAAVIDRPEANRVFQGNSSTGSSNYSDPHKNASLGVVVKQFAQTCCGKIGLSHDTVPSLIGQRPARVDSTGGLRYFITRSFSWIAEVTKCLYQIASKAVGVCMPTNHCGPFHPYGASAPSTVTKETS